MTVLSDLPIEILTNIMSAVVDKDNSVPFLCSMSTLCHAFHQTLPSFIFNNYEIKFENLPMELVNPAKHILLMRSLKENPSLSSHIHEMRIDWKRGDQETHRLVNELLGLLTNLKSLSIFAKDDKESFQPHFLKVNSMPLLKNVTLDDEQLSMENIKQYLVLESVEKMKIASYIPGSFSKSAEMDGKTSPLLSLDIDENFHIPLDSLRGILEICPRIKSLRLGLPGKGIPGSARYDMLDDPVKETTPLSPIRLSQTLAVARTSLQRLELLVCGCLWPSIARTRMDLSMISALTYISCPSKCLFPDVWGTLYTSRTWLYRMLPSGLESLAVNIPAPKHFPC